MLAATYNTLQDFLFHTEGIVYLLMAAFLLLFLGFVISLGSREERE